MSKRTAENPLFVVYNSKPIVDFYDTGAFVTPSGFRLAVYPLASDEVKFLGSYLECSFILKALQDYSQN